MKDFHVQIATAIPPIEKIDSRKGRTFRALITMGSSRRLSAYVKLLNLEDIAREVLCAVLARKLHLPMLQPFYVGVDPSYLVGYSLANFENVAYGLEADNLPTHKIRGNLEEELLLWPELKRCAVFDEWIGNNDRYPDNLLFAGNQLFWLIDHDECLPSLMSPNSVLNTKLLQILTRGKSEFERHALRKELMRFVEDYKALNWDEILDLVRPAEISGIEIYYLKFIALLRSRMSCMYEVISQNLGIRQHEMELVIPSSMEGGTKS